MNNSNKNENKNNNHGSESYQAIRKKIIAARRGRGCGKF